MIPFFAFLFVLFFVCVVGKRGDVWLQKSDFYLSPLAAKKYIAGLTYDLSHSFNKYLLSAYWVSGIVPGHSSTGSVKQT